MIAGIYNITCEQGATFNRRFTITQPDGTPFYLNDYSARMQVRRDIDSSTILLSITSATENIVLSNALGIIDVYLTPTQTASLTRSGVYDLELVHTPSNNVYRVVKGAFKLDKEVTK
jgi:hypothetical protein